MPQLIILIYKDVVEACLRSTQGCGSSSLQDAGTGAEAPIDARTDCWIDRQPPDAQPRGAHKDYPVDRAGPV